jgi:uncharacterized protein (TIGR03084 family)
VDRSLLDDLRAEEQALDDLLAAADARSWSCPTPAAGWTVADTIRHLLVAELAATRSVRDRTDFVGGSHGTGVEAGTAAAALGASGDVDGSELLAEWRAARGQTLAALAVEPDDARVPWGGRDMGVRSLATARLMETWAHGLDCFAALDAPVHDTDRLRHVAWLGWRTLPYAFAVARREPPAPITELRIELAAPSGASWVYGHENADHVVRGPASAWCRVVTHRWREPAPPPLAAHGALAVAALEVAQAYLDL